MASDSQSQVGLTVVHQRYVSHQGARFTDRSADVGYLVGLLSDVAAEMCVRTDGDEGRFVSLSDVDFTAPVYPGDFLQISGRLARVGARSREIHFEALLVGRNARNLPDAPSNPRSSSASVMDPQVTVIRAIGTCVVPSAKPDYAGDLSDRPTWGRRRPDADPAAEIDDY